MLDISLIAASLKSREAFSTIKQFTDRKDFDDVAWAFFDAIDAYYYIDDSVQSCDSEIISEKVERNNPRFQKIIQNYAEKIKEKDVSAVNVTAAICEKKLAGVNEEILTALANGKTLGQIPDLVEKASTLEEHFLNHSLIVNEVDEYVGDDLVSLGEHLKDTKKITILGK